MSGYFSPIDGWMFCPEHHEMWGEGEDIRIEGGGDEVCRSWEPGQPHCQWVVVFVKEGE